MDMSDSPAIRSFREQVRDFLATNRSKAPSGMSGSNHGQAMDWQRLLIENGYAARTIPEEYGGFGAEPDPLASLVIAEEFTAAGVPMGFSNQGISMLVPTLLEMGTEEQKKKYIPPTLRGEMVWCQGYSEPGAGSDLASLRTRATDDGDDFLVNGQKIWTSTAHAAHMMFCLVRSEPDAPKHEGISYVLIPMDTPGLEVRPLKTMTGHAEFNEVFFTDVRVPKTQTVGKRGEGWRVANATLKHERGMLGDPDATGARFRALVDLMNNEQVNGVRLMDSPVLRDRLLALQGRVMAMRYNGLRLLSARTKGGGGQGGAGARMAGLIVKLQGCELNHQISALALDALGEFGLLYGAPDERMRNKGQWQWAYMFQLGLIIGGGTAQIQKNIIAERGLGMPREPKVRKPDQK
ncbi:MAG: acyl-CoA dehydrogenase family protein [Parvularculales bacterium]